MFYVLLKNELSKEKLEGFLHIEIKSFKKISSDIPSVSSRWFPEVNTI